MASRRLVWRCGGRELVCGERTLVMGILNVTPDSFSDGGLFLDPEAAVAHARRMVEEGADIVDVGGESTRPGSDPVPPEEERKRVLPVIEALAPELEVPISVDTRRAEVAAAALEAGASIVNDVTAGADPDMFAVVRDAGAGMVLMHMKGEPKTMQRDPRYDDVVAEVRAYLAARLDAAARAGIDAERLCVDPGIGFGKTLEHNLLLLRHVDALVDLGRPVLVGPSRKSFIGTLLDLPPDQRVEGTLGAVCWAAARGAHAVRVHDVREAVRALRVVDAIARAGG
ncbi:MAG TPA: dihydropteroate synthase [Actinomycetota bacterium]|nr:dihydropteroate synthase [Actinomycetota bacterium]